MRELERIIEDDDIPLEKRHAAQEALFAICGASSWMNLADEEIKEYYRMTFKSYIAEDA